MRSGSGIWRKMLADLWGRGISGVMWVVIVVLVLLVAGAVALDVMSDW